MTKRKRERKDKVIVRPMLDHSDWVFVFLDASSCPVKAEHYELVLDNFDFDDSETRLGLVPQFWLIQFASKHR